jgi:phosphoserine/homoserine phosphotransferase
MFVCCFDLEGVLLPEFWIRVSGYFKRDELRLTTRDIADYDQLMKYRINILRKSGIKLSHIQTVINKINPLPGAMSFLSAIRNVYPVVILSDTFYEFARPPIKKLGNPVLFCNRLTVDRSGFINGYVLRQKNGKQRAVLALKNIGFQVKAVGDSYNDLAMLEEADEGILFNPPNSIRNKYKTIPVANNYRQLSKILLKN